MRDIKDVIITSYVRSVYVAFPLSSTNLRFIMIVKRISGVALFKVNSRNTRTICDIYPKLTVKAPK